MHPLYTHPSTAFTHLLPIRLIPFAFADIAAITHDIKERKTQISSTGTVAAGVATGAGKTKAGTNSLRHHDSSRVHHIHHTFITVFIKGSSHIPHRNHQGFTTSSHIHHVDVHLTMFP
jgi:hypothetical protein